MESSEMALEELKVLADIISRHDEISLKIKGWCTTLVTGFLVAMFSGTIQAPLNVSGLLVAVIIVIFLWIDVVFRVAEDRAINRQGEVEKALRGEVQYDGPKIKWSLSTPNTFRDQLRSLNNNRIYLPYVALSIIVFSGVYFSSARS